MRGTPLVLADYAAVWVANRQAVRDCWCGFSDVNLIAWVRLVGVERDFGDGAF